MNYFPYAYPAPEGDQAFRPTVTLMPTPWNPDTRLVHVAIQGAMPATENRPPLNLVFLIDTSGSMEDANKLPLLVQSLSMLQGQLHDGDPGGDCHLCRLCRAGAGADQSHRSSGYPWGA